jgi:hypothetical protein
MVDLMEAVSHIGVWLYRQLNNMLLLTILTPNLMTAFRSTLALQRTSIQAINAKIGRS